MKEAAEKLGVERSSLGRWRDQYLERLERSGAGSDLAMSPKEMAAEIASLRKQLKRSELHREILKKAAEASGLVLESSKMANYEATSCGSMKKAEGIMAARGFCWRCARKGTDAAASGWRV